MNGIFILLLNKHYIRNRTLFLQNHYLLYFDSKRQYYKMWIIIITNNIFFVWFPRFCFTVSVIKNQYSLTLNYVCEKIKMNWGNTS